MISMFQGWRFQRWRQASLWTVKQIQRRRIRGITGRRSESNARGACRIIGDNSTGHFCWEPWEWFKNKEIECLMNWNWETLKGDFSLANSWFKDNREKVFCIGLWLEMRSGYSMITPRRKNYAKSVNRCHRPQHQHYEHSWFEDHALYLIGPKGSCLLWAAKTWRFHYGRSVSATIDSYIWAVHCKKNGRNTSKDMIKLFFFMTTLGLMSLKS